jgi:hypothetical protein
MNTAADDDITEEKLTTFLLTDSMNKISVGHCN